MLYNLYFISGIGCSFVRTQNLKFELTEMTEYSAVRASRRLLSAHLRHYNSVKM
jgi:hypothetical protein